jgi:hypothetical protein
LAFGSAVTPMHTGGHDKTNDWSWDYDAECE